MTRNKKWLRTIVVLCAVITLASLFSLPVLADWDGGGAGTGNGPVSGLDSSYKIKGWNEYACLAGYRFTGVNPGGARPKGKPSWDVILDARWNEAQHFYRAYVGGVVPYSSKIEYAAAAKGGSYIPFSLKVEHSNMMKESDLRSLGARNELPHPKGSTNSGKVDIAAGLNAWQIQADNIKAIGKKIGFPNGKDSMLKGDLIIVEPLFAFILDNKWVMLTTSEYAQIGKRLHGKDNSGWPKGASGIGINTWGYISNYTNGFFLNYLYPGGSYSYWGKAQPVQIVSKNGKDRPASRKTFQDIIVNGYGVGVCYEEKNNKATDYHLTVNPAGGTWEGNVMPVSITTHMSETKTIPNPTRTGYIFAGWNVSGNGSMSGTTYTQGAGDCTLTATWREVTPSHQLTVDPNGGTWRHGNTKYTVPHIFELEEGAHLTVETPTKPGAVFKGWEIIGGGSIDGNTYTQGSGSCTLKAKWADIIYGYLRFIEKPYLNTLEEFSPWRHDERLSNLLDTEITAENSEQVWHFSQKDYYTVHEWCLNHRKGADTNDAFLRQFGSHRIK